MIETKFAVTTHLMTALAYNSDKWMSSEELSKSLRTNPSFIRKLIGSLVKAGLVKSQRGKIGGVQLNLAATEIKLSQIYEAISEKNLILLPQKEPFYECPVSLSMGRIMGSISQNMEEAVLASLQSIYLSDVLKQVSCSS
ncbi:MAG: Rrf2 family transcriptional regulator [Leptospiraceae bacterium]|jgi:Rrf2 family protein|nr:Rrf2 family transcriptional regulator [Leptospiraceae bacterium]MCZ8347162.1 Rrf2 family transcriptional regulator [Leptospiraceae bacterium]PJE00604.1 MAG: transcriptional regulator [Leptospira sp.]